MIKVLTRKGIIEEYNKGIIGVWTDDNLDEWELFWNENKEFIGVALRFLTPEQIEQIEKDCENNEGFYSPLFEGTDISEYDIKEEINISTIENERNGVMNNKLTKEQFRNIIINALNQYGCLKNTELGSGYTDWHTENGECGLTVTLTNGESFTMVIAKKQ